MRTNKIMAFFLTVALLIGFIPPITAYASWDGTTGDTAWYDNNHSTDTAFTIHTAQELAGLAQLVNGGNNFSGKTITLGADIVLNDTVYWTLWETSAPANTWAPIGKELFPFSGLFDGNNHTVSGIYISDPASSYQGLFGNVAHGTIQNLGVKDSYIKGNNYVGGVVGQINDGAVSNCYNTGTISSSGNFTGGVAGWANSCIVQNCYNTGTINGTASLVGGVAGVAKSSIVQNCNNTGNVNGNNYVGGVVGYADSGTGSVIDCNNTGIVKGTGNYTGGVVGYIYSIPITSCHNAGTVNGADRVGGVAGVIDSKSAKSCYNTGSVNGTTYVGGVAGNITSSTVENCYNTGTIVGTREVGGVAGRVYYNNATIISCYNIGEVSGTEDVGGVVGLVYASTIKSCYYNIDTVGTDHAPSDSIGLNDSGLITDVLGKIGAAFTGGEVAYILQGIQTSQVWGQKLSGSSVDYAPILTSDAAKVVYLNAPGIYSNPTAVMLLSATADGTANTTTSTKIDLVFSAAVAGLIADDITITNGTGKAVKGGLTGAGIDWSITLTSVETQGSVTLEVSLPTTLYALTGSPQNVTVYKETPPQPVSTGRSVTNTSATVAVVSGISTLGNTLRVTVNSNEDRAAVDLGNLKGDSFTGEVVGMITMPSIPGVSAYTLEVSSASLSGSKGEGTLTFATDMGSITIPDNMLSGISGTNGKKAGITIGLGDKSGLPDEVKVAIGNRPLVQLTLILDGVLTKWNNPSAPVIVSIPYVPTTEELKDPENITIWYVDGSGNIVPVTSGKYNPDTGMVTFSTTHFSNYAVAYVIKTFDDLGSVVWAKKPTEVLASKGILKGATESKYTPQTNITRADFLYFLVRTLGVDSKVDGNFDDISSDAYYYKEIGIAKKLGITSGKGNNKFIPDVSITRQDMMVLTDRALRALKKHEVQGEASDLDQFTDKSLVSIYAVEGVASVVKERLIVGSGDKINPRGTTTRAEAAVFLYRIYNHY